MKKKSVQVKKNKSKNLSSDLYLKKGDLIDIVAPGSACPEELLEKGCAWLKSKGFKVRVHKNIINPKLYLSNSDEFRFNNLKNALYATDSKALWCLRGGYGTFRLWPELLKLKRPKKAKFVIGISDITSLHQFLNQHWNWPSIHGYLLDRIGAGLLQPNQELELLDLITGKTSETIFKSLKPLNQSASQINPLKKEISGYVWGGNLCTYMASMGTALHPKPCIDKPVILVFEDLGERGYRIDRFLQQLYQSVDFKFVKAIVFGDFLGGNEPDGKNLILETLNLFAKQLDHSKFKTPVFSGLSFGHADVQTPFILNQWASFTKINNDKFDFKITNDLNSISFFSAQTERPNSIK